eukprot:jgi/Psemu1/8562/gm1.8562_g
MLDLHQLPAKARGCHKFKEVDLPLVSVPKLCNHGYQVTFTRDNVEVLGPAKNTVLEGVRDPLRNLYMVPLHSEPASLAPPWCPLLFLQYSQLPALSRRRQLQQGLLPYPQKTKTYKFKLHVGAGGAYQIQAVPKLLNFYHAAVGYPTKATWVSAIDQRSFATWPGLTVQQGNQYLEDLEETTMSHMQLIRQGIQSTRRQPTISMEEVQPMADITTIGTDTTEPKELVLACDLPGRYPVMSHRGHKYVFLMYSNYDSNYIDVEPIKSGKSEDILGDYQLASLGDYRLDHAECAIQTFKNHFITCLNGVDEAYLVDFWDLSIPQALITLNLVRASQAQPKLSAYKLRHRAYDYNKHRLAPLGCQDHGTRGFYVWPALKHHRNYTCIGGVSCKLHALWTIQGLLQLASPAPLRKVSQDAAKQVNKQFNWFPADFLTAREALDMDVEQEFTTVCHSPSQYGLTLTENGPIPPSAAVAATHNNNASSNENFNSVLNSQVVHNLFVPPIDRNLMESQLFPSEDNSNNKDMVIHEEICLPIQNDNDMDAMEPTASQPNINKREQLIQSHVYFSPTNRLIAEIKLLNLMTKHKSPLNTFKSIFQWANECQNIHGVDFSTTFPTSLSPENNPPITNETYITELHHGSWWTESWKQICNENEEILVPIVFYMDGISLDAHGHLSLTPLNMTLEHKTHKKPTAKDNTQNLHIALAAALQSFKQVCEMHGRLEWDYLWYAGKVFKVKMKFAIAYGVGDTGLHDKLCGKYGSYTEKVKKLCQHCTCPTHVIHKPKAQVEEQTRLWVPDDFKSPQTCFQGNTRITSKAFPTIP